MHLVNSVLPVVVLVGRPNVGKSTLFNRMTRTQDALVADFPGLTRDRQYGQAVLQGKSFILVDTGGVGVLDPHLDGLMKNQLELALKEADLILFLVDGRAGILPEDTDLAIALRKTGKPVFLLVNKTDGLQPELACLDFQTLGFPKLYPISASHGRGLLHLANALVSSFEIKEGIEEEEKDENEEEEKQAIQVAFVGRPNVGKSTLINRLLGEERVLVYDAPGTTRDSIAIPFEKDGINYKLIDTAGVRRKGRVKEKIEKFSVIKTLQSIDMAQICLMLLDAREGLTEQDLHLLGFIIEAGKSLVIVVNKWDGLEHSHKEEVKRELERRLYFVNFAKIRFISALHGTGVGLLLKDVQKAHASAMQSLSTAGLTRILGELVQAHTPPLVNGRRIKLRYAHAGGKNPPLIVIHGNQLESLPLHYHRYLIHGFINKLELKGTPVKLSFKTSDNPFKDKKNTLTPRQVRKRKRLLRRVKK